MTARAVLLAVAVLLACAPYASAGPIDRFLDRTWPQGAGGTVIAARDGKIVTCKGLGPGGRCDTVYDIMSMTKQFTAAAIVKLEAMGKLRVSDPISRFLGPVPADKRAITVHQLLTHTAGMVEALGDDYDPLSRAAMLEGALATPLRSVPGAEYHYSNLGYSVLAAIVEQASGMSYERFLAGHLFAPAGMKHTGYVLPHWKRRRVAVEYDPRGRSHGRPYDHPWAADGPYWNLRGNGGMLSTARDMFRWHRALEGNAILGRRAKAKLFTPYVAEEPGGPDYGYGWVLERTPAGRAAWHDGGNGWSLGVIARFQDRRLMVFWVSNHAYQRGGWNLERRAGKLTLGIAERLTPAPRPAGP